MGAAIASVSGQIDRIFHLGTAGRRAALDEACGEARERAVAAGAEPGTVRIIEMEEIPLAYLTSPRGADPGQGSRHPRRPARPASSVSERSSATSRSAEGSMKAHRAGLLAAGCALLVVLAAWGAGSARPGRPAAGQQPGVHLRHRRAGDGQRLGPLSRNIRRSFLSSWMPVMRRAITAPSSRTRNSRARST